MLSFFDGLLINGFIQEPKELWRGVAVNRMNYPTCIYIDEPA